MEKKRISVSLCVLIHSYCVMVETELCSPVWYEILEFTDMKKKNN